MLKGQRTATEVRTFAHKVYNARKRPRRPDTHSSTRAWRSSVPVFSFPEDEKGLEPLPVQQHDADHSEEELEHALSDLLNMDINDLGVQDGVGADELPLDTFFG